MNNDFMFRLNHRLILQDYDGLDDSINDVQEFITTIDVMKLFNIPSSITHQHGGAIPAEITAKMGQVTEGIEAVTVYLSHMIEVLKSIKVGAVSDHQKKIDDLIRGLETLSVKLVGEFVQPEPEPEALNPAPQ